LLRQRHSTKAINREIKLKFWISFAIFLDRIKTSGLNNYFATLQNVIHLEAEQKKRYSGNKTHEKGIII
jgi:hypothetical protein